MFRAATLQRIPKRVDRPRGVPPRRRPGQIRDFAASNPQFCQLTPRSRVLVLMQQCGSRQDAIGGDGMTHDEQWTDEALLNSPFAWWEWDVASNLVRISALKATMLGYDAEEFRGRGFEAFTSLLHPDDYDKTMRAMGDVLEGRSAIFHVDYRILASDGGYRWYMDRGTVLARNAQGKPARLRGIVIDLGRELQAGNNVEALVHLMGERVRQKDHLILLCSGCKKLEIKPGSWLPFAQDLSRIVGLPVSHGLCPTCLRTLYPDIADEVLEELQDAESAGLAKCVPNQVH
jgi:PAS domain S-box-containing protein